MSFRSPAFCTLLVFVCWFCVGARLGSAQSVFSKRLDFRSSGLEPGETLIALSRASGVVIGFSDQMTTASSARVQIDVKNEKLSVILDRVLEGTGLGWRAAGEQITLFRKPPPDLIVSGFVEDAGSGERLVGAFVMHATSARSATTNNYGFFSIRLPAASATQLAISVLGYQPAMVKISQTARGGQVFRLQPMQMQMEEIEVKVDHSEGRLRSFSSSLEENLARLPWQQMPALGGESDLMRVAAFLPGVESSIDGLGGWSVRGGDTDQNLVLIDDAVVFNPVHGLGLFSVFNPDIVRSARLWKGDAPAGLGGRLSSALDVRTREGNMQRPAGSVSLGWMAARASLELPLKKDRGAILFSARRSLAGGILKHFTKKDLQKQGWQGYSNYYFSDLNLKTNWVFDTRNRVYLSLYEGRDFFTDTRTSVYNDSMSIEDPIRISQDYSSQYNWKNRFASLRWNHLFSDRCFSNTTFTTSRFHLRSQNSQSISIEGIPDAQDFTIGSLSETRLKDYSLKTDLDWYVSDRLTLRGGIQANLLQVLPFYYIGNGNVIPYWLQLDDANMPEVADNVRYEKSTNFALHGQGEWAAKGWKMRAGLRMETFTSRDKTWWMPQPRFYLERNWHTGWTWTASVNSMAQVLRTVSPNYIESTGDVWLTASASLPPQQSVQGCTGVTWTRNGWTAKGEIFLKTMKNVEEYVARWTLPSNDSIFLDPNEITEYINGIRSWENEVDLGKGRSAGLELTLEKTAGRTTGWVSWSLSRSDRKFENLNDRQWFPARFDRRHHARIILMHRFSKHFSASAAWQFATGDAISRLASNSSEQARLLDLHGQNLSFERLGFGDYRQSTQHRLDCSAMWEWQSGRVKQHISAGFYNAYNRSNNYFTYWGYDNSGQEYPALRRRKINGLPLLPSLSWHAEF